jgi:uncharacterized membrane protein
MYIINFSDTLLAMAVILFLIGLLMLLLGIFVLITRAMSRDMRAISAHTAKLAGKGITDDMSGMVGNASALMASLTSMVKTAAGIGIFLTISGMILMGTGYWMLLQVDWPI